MGDWTSTTLGEVIAAGGGWIQTGPFGSQLHASDYVDVGIPCIMPMNMKGNRVDLTGIAFISDKDAARLSRHLVEEGDIVYSRRGDVTQKALIGKEQVGYFCGTGCLLVRPGHAVDPEFLVYYLSTSPIKDWIVNQAVGATMPNLNTGILAKLPLTIPDFDTQKRIASVLSALDAKITLNQRINAELEAMAKLLYDYWFVQFDFPISKEMAARIGKPAAAGRPYKSSGGPMVYSAVLKREVPEGWGITELRKYIKSNRGHSYTSAEISGEGRPMINLNSFNINATYKGEGLKLYSGKLNPSKVLEPFDLVMCITQQTALDPAKDVIGKTLIVPDIFDKEIVSSADVATIRASKENLKYYLNSLFNSEYFHRYISGYCSGSNILHLNFEGVLFFQTAMPDDGLLKSFGAMVQNFEQRKSTSLKENHELATLRDWLLPMLMNGQVTVGAAAEKVGLAMAAEPAGKYGRRKP